MQITNQGIISVPEANKENLINALNSIGMETSEADIWIEDGKAETSIEDVYGDIEDELYKLANSFITLGISIELEVDYYGDNNGKYVVENNKFINLSSEELVIKNAETQGLIDELEKRGYAVIKEK